MINYIDILSLSCTGCNSLGERFGISFWALKIPSIFWLYPTFRKPLEEIINLSKKIFVTVCFLFTYILFRFFVSNDQIFMRNKCNFMLISKSIVLTYSVLTTYQTISHQLEISNKYRHQFSGLIKNLNPREHKFPQDVKTEIQRSLVFLKISKISDPRLKWNYYLNILLFVVLKGY